ncbi:hypothetical protein ColTof4_13767 [Colletotrichum tofieldiae]|uniref:Uncharacterized protein n=1 Tax=Colletotrichum tofieldiae TaxID=708197 RepID=A0A166YHL2_9PEZI|nr:hypothetical protein CT0861_08173 [Colletotrichum tofieldiae]GKT54440.1 hypothetical protein ColTof3_01779 [Colletotrichum tofieldiae]GKT81344.1 hypothetical protein ColTof4_13767 [Colletotrichum tofieldiae]GKT84030.1 hypothetical protein Ct61P_01880 [Colletotrichum tofieldiae]
MAPSKDQLMETAAQAQLDMNTYQSKTGAARPQGNDDAGVSSVQTEKRFPGASVSVQGDPTNNVSYKPEQPAKDPAYDDDDVVPAKKISSLGTQDRKDDVLLQGEGAVRNNVGTKPPGVGGNKFPGSDYYTPESVPDSISAEGNIAPESVTQASAEAENPR